MSMTLSFRTDDELADALTAEAERLGVSRSDILNKALSLYLYGLACERDAAIYEANPLSADDRVSISAQYVLPAEDWSNL
jgi:Ribbon-helix-helix protein, copG family